MKNIKQLMDLGLEGKEAKVYLSCLELGSSTISPICTKAKLPKTTVYDLLKALSSKGLVTSYTKKGRKVFTASDPAVMKDHLKSQSVILEEILPDLQRMFNSSEHSSKLRYLEGMKGLDVMMEEIRTEATETFAISASEHLAKIHPFIKRVTTMRLKNKIPAKLITTDSKFAREHMLRDKTELRNTRVIEAANFPPFSFLYIYGNKVAFASIENEGELTIISDPLMAQIMKGIFHVMWRNVPAVATGN